MQSCTKYDIGLYQSNRGYRVDGDSIVESSTDVYLRKLHLISFRSFHSSASDDKDVLDLLVEYDIIRQHAESL